MITATLFLVFAVITILGMPIALALVGGGMAAIVAGDLMPLFTSVQKMFSSVDSFTLAAIPFFMLAGALMSSGGISRRLIDFANAAVGWMPGGLGVVTIFSCMLFGCLCGSPTATVAAIGAVWCLRWNREAIAANSPCPLLLQPVCWARLFRPAP